MYFVSSFSCKYSYIVYTRAMSGISSNKYLAFISLVTAVYSVHLKSYFFNIIIDIIIIIIFYYYNNNNNNYYYYSMVFSLMKRCWIIN